MKTLIIQQSHTTNQHYPMKQLPKEGKENKETSKDAPIDKTLKKLDQENLAISLHKCEFGLTEITWLGYKINSEGITPTKRKTDAIIQLENPKTLKQLRSFMGSIHHLVKFIPNLATLSAPLRPLLTKQTNKTPKKLEWEEIHTNAFNKIKQAIKTIVEQKHFDINCQSRIKCDASKEGLGACLEQRQNNIWQPIAYASRFLNKNEQRYSINELELLAVVWSLEHFKYYLYGSHFTLQTDHQALLSALNPQVETFQVPIQKRYRAPNTTKTKMMTNQLETNTIATQTDETSNIGLGRQPLDEKEEFNPIPELDYQNTPNYLKQLHRVFGENFIAEATRNDPHSKNLLQIIEDKNWDLLKHFSRYWHSLKRDLSTTPAGCILYDGKMYIPTQLRKLIMNSIHRNHPGQSGMMHLANMIWFPRIHREIVTLTKNCQPCIKIGKNLKPIIPKSHLANLPPLYEPNEEIQMDFAGPIIDEQNNDSYILASVDRFSRYPHAKVYHNCDTDTAIKYLEKYIKFHGIPRNIRCDQAQAFKSRQFEIFCNNHNIKLILAPAGDHRANGMIERLIQTIKRRLSVLNNDPKWSKIKLADKITEIIQEIKLIPNTTTKIAPFTAHFGRKQNTPISNITSRTSPKNLSYNEITKFHLDKRRGLKQPMLKADTIWNLESDSEPHLDIQFQPTIEGDDSSDQSTLQNIKKKAIKRKNTSPIKITPDKLLITFGDKTTSITNTRKQIARKTLARKAPEPRGTLKPLWNIIPDGTITNYSPSTITLDTNTRKNTVIRKNDLAIINETKPRLMHFVACKTVREYNRNQEKIKQFLLTEKKQLKQSKQKNQLDRQEEQTNTNEAHFYSQPGPSYSQPGPSYHFDTPGPNNRFPSQRKRKQQPQKRTTKPKSDFDRKSKEAAIAQSKLNKAKEHQRRISNSPRIQLDTSKLEQNKSIEVINLISDSSQGSPIKIFTSDDPTAFMSTPARKKSQEQVNKKIEKIIHRITHSPKKQQNNDENPISIISTSHTGLSQDITPITPSHKSTPVGTITKAMTTTQNTAKNSTNDYQLVKTNAPTTTICENKNDNQLLHTTCSADTNDDTRSQNNHPKQKQIKKTIKHNIEEQQDIPEERENINEPIDLIHMEEDNGESLTSSSISSLNTEDIAALDKLFD